MPSCLCGSIIDVSSYVDQLNLILGVLGTPDEDTLQRVGSEKVRSVSAALTEGDHPADIPRPARTSEVCPIPSQCRSNLSFRMLNPMVGPRRASHGRGRANRRSLISQLLTC